MMGEHSPVDAGIPSIAVDYVLSEPVNERAFSSPSSPGSSADRKGWDRLDWVVDDAMKQEIEACQGRNRKIIEDSDAGQLWWGEYGAEWIEREGKVEMPLICRISSCRSV